MNEKCLSILVLITHCKMAISCGSNLLKDRSKWSSAGKKVILGGWEEEEREVNVAEEGKKEALFLSFV